MKKFCTFLCVFLLFSTSYSQGWETLGKGVIDFLRTNPKTASRTNATQAAALNVIGDVLSISAQRKHDMNVANAGRSEVVINTSRDNSATVYSDTQGNVYLLYNGTIYPISRDLVYQAKSEFVKPSIKNATLPDYNLSLLKNEYKFNKDTIYVFCGKKKWRRPAIQNTVGKIASEFGVSRDDIYFEPRTYRRKKTLQGKKYSLLDLLNTKPKKVIEERIREIYNSQRELTFKNVSPIIGCDDFTDLGKNTYISFKFPGIKNEKNAEYFSVYIHSKVEEPKAYYKLDIVTVFSCNWAKDFDGKGFDFEDFQGIKRSFGENEKITFVLGYTSETPAIWRLETYEISTGKEVLFKSGVTKSGGQILCWDKGIEKLLPGVYIYNFTLISEGKKNVSKSEKFEILDDNDN